jgi:hypothetical protein
MAFSNAGPARFVTVAVASKTACIAGAVMAREENFRIPVRPAIKPHNQDIGKANGRRDARRRARAGMAVMRLPGFFGSI